VNKKSLLFLFVLLACGHIKQAQSGSFHVMVYNVENLFDAQHDEGKNDFTYLSKKFPTKESECNKIGYKRYRRECLRLDWTADKVDFKLSQVEKVIRAFQKSHSKEKTPPAVLGLVEVENENVVSKLAKKLNYKKFVVTNSPDKRGVDVALLINEDKKLKYVSHKEHLLKDEYFKSKPTRNILEVKLRVGGKYDLYVFVNHWPSLGNPTSTRLVAAKTVQERIKSLKKENKLNHFLVMGDFNTIPENHPHPFHTHLLKDNLLYDTHATFMKDRKVSWNKKNATPPGSYFYARKMQWNLLDRIFYDGNLKDNSSLEIVPSSYRIFSAPFMTTSYIYQQKGDYLAGSQVQNIPNRYKHNESDNTKQGYSDHFPVSVQLQW
jgi:endonuclease/exonuclease/phosphatase family metal-dependent hydrolase